ncbi:hypothetical protein [Krasilnikovia sp. MM14-A1259]|uniref:hypothetical protein n=1 Tax=Krasilnikovia sp. MM14-A1259 TaxID=3373539 RepID=UPI0038254841
MSTYMGAAWLDLTDGVDASAQLAEVRWLLEGTPEVTAWVRETPGGGRIELASDDVEYAELASLVASIMEETPAIRRAVIALDHDEYGAEHIVLVTVDGEPRRVHHVYVYPRDAETGEPYVEGEPTLTDVPPLAAPEPSDDPGAVVDGREARASLARLFDIPVELVEKAAVKAASAHEDLMTVGAPFAAWHEVLNVQWIGESGAEWVDLRSDK